MKKIPIILILCIMAYSVSFSVDQNSLDGIDEFIKSEMEYWKVPGLAIAVVKDGEIIYKKAFGVRNLETQENITENTVFSIASSTKAFTSTIAGMLSDEGKLNLDKPVIEYLPEFRLKSNEATEKATLRHFLSHKSGLPRHDVLWDNETTTRDGMLTRISNLELSAAPGEKWQYSNLNYIIVGAAISKVTKKTWEENVRERILEPLEMNLTFFSVSDTAKFNDYASPYIMDKKDEIETLAFKNSDILGPAGAIRSNISDMAKWLQFNLNTGNAGGRQLIQNPTLRRLQTPVTTTGWPMRDKEVFYQTYGCGWFIDSFKGKMHIHHGGVLFGFTSMVSFIPYEKTGVVILANMNGTPLTNILEYTIYDKLLNLDETDWSGRNRQRYERIKEYYAKMAEKGDQTLIPETQYSHSLDNYTGKYENPGYGTFTVTMAGDSLQVETSIYTMPLGHYHYDIFKMSNPVAKEEFLLNFRTGEDGTISGFDAKFEPTCEPVSFRKIE